MPALAALAHASPAFAPCRDRSGPRAGVPLTGPGPYRMSGRPSSWFDPTWSALSSCKWSMSRLRLLATGPRCKQSIQPALRPSLALSCLPSDAQSLSTESPAQYKETPGSVGILSIFSSQSGLPDIHGGVQNLRLIAHEVRIKVAFQHTAALTDVGCYARRSISAVAHQGW